MQLRISRPNILDFEASGFGNDSYPIEVGVVLSAGEKYCALIQPAGDWDHWDPKAEQVHGLSRGNVVNHGKPIALVAQELNTFLADQTVYSDGWVVDQHWLSRLFSGCGMAPRFHLSALEMIMKESQMEIWSQTRQQVVADLALTRHRASADALIIQETYFRTRQTISVDTAFGVAVEAASPAM